ncbi:DUF1002 domain-containing protein [Bacillus coahuilensis]|uniref:DUF1002 domain-containing protein n=1 Tax=Bacillus coahuilensis TaxID=408580 RepID=UPI0001850F15|nr:DUF1002 domain-containing protein [Bacillus coahuilensis]
MPIVAYGGSLNENQLQQVKELLNVTDSSMVEEITVTGEDLAKYIQGENRNANMYSSAKITRQEAEKGIEIIIVTPEDITEVTESMYANALITAGVEGAIIEVASPVTVSGHSALTGIYKAYDVEGITLDADRMEVANEELTIATELVEGTGIDQEQVSELLTEIKKQIAEQNPATKEDVQKIVEEQLSKLNIELNEEDRQMLIDLFDKMRALEIDFGGMKDQLNELTKDIQDQLDQIIQNDTFWAEVKSFFQSIVDFFTRFTW